MKTPERRAISGACGFTLIELLVTIAIVAILAAILVPVGSRFLSQSKESQCLGNLKQIGSGIFAYVADQGGYLPPVRQQLNAGDTWQQSLIIQRYLNQKTVFCPAADGRNRGWAGTKPDYAASTRTSAANPIVGSRVGILGSAIAPQALAVVKAPSRALLVADACSPALGVLKGDWALDLRHFVAPTASISASNVAPRHGIRDNNMLTGKFGALFADGHVEMMAWNDSRFAQVDFLREFLHAE